MALINLPVAYDKVSLVTSQNPIRDETVLTCIGVKC